MIDVYVMPKSEDLSGISNEVNKLIGELKLPKNAIVSVHGAVVGMHESFSRFGIGLLLSVMLVYLDPDGAVPVVHRSLHYFDGDSAGTGGRGAFLWMTRHDAEHHVA